MHCNWIGCNSSKAKLYLFTEIESAAAICRAHYAEAYRLGEIHFKSGFIRSLRPELAQGYDLQKRVYHQCDECGFGWRQKLRRLLTEHFGKMHGHIAARDCPRCQKKFTCLPDLPFTIIDMDENKYLAVIQLDEESFRQLPKDILEIVAA